MGVYLNYLQKNKYSIYSFGAVGKDDHGPQRFVVALMPILSKRKNCCLPTFHLFWSKPAHAIQRL